MMIFISYLDPYVGLNPDYLDLNRIISEFKVRFVWIYIKSRTNSLTDKKRLYLTHNTTKSRRIFRSETLK